jgi:hypothetical protein
VTPLGDTLDLNPSCATCQCGTSGMFSGGEWQHLHCQGICTKLAQPLRQAQYCWNTQLFDPTGAA